MHKPSFSSISITHTNLSFKTDIKAILCIHLVSKAITPIGRYFEWTTAFSVQTYFNPIKDYMVVVSSVNDKEQMLKLK